MRCELACCRVVRSRRRSLAYSRVQGGRVNSRVVVRFLGMMMNGVLSFGWRRCMLMLSRILVWDGVFAVSKMMDMNWW